MISNDQLKLTPTTEFDGPALEFDFPGLEIGIAEYDEGPTGCTVFHLLNRALLSVDVRGGSVGRCGEYLSSIDAICLAGGSLFGLEAIHGVTAELFARRGYALGFGDLPLVTGAITYDFGRRSNAIYPDKALGRAALRAAREGRFPLGPRGAGRMASVGKVVPGRQAETSGQGAAFGRFGDCRVAVFTMVNALGVIVNREGTPVRGGVLPSTGQHNLASDMIGDLASLPPWHIPADRRRSPEQSGDRVGQNTTLTVLVTDARLNPHSRQQLGRQVHDSMARAIQPFHTPLDGDILFTVSTEQVELADPSGMRLGIMASELAWDAVLACY